jgi:hypothetical protein
MPLKLRPRFTLDVDVPPEVVEMHLFDGLVRPDLELSCTPAQTAESDHPAEEAKIVIAFRPQFRQLWSPWLTLHLVPSGTESRPRTQVIGRYSPHPTLWTAMSAAYLALAIVGFFSTVTAYSEWTHDEPLSGIGGAILCAFGAFSLWASAQMGKHLASGQMGELQSRIEAVLVPGASLEPERPT